jgi:hypothetical protein
MCFDTIGTDTMFVNVCSDGVLHDDRVRVRRGDRAEVDAEQVECRVLLDQLVGEDDVSRRERLAIRPLDPALQVHRERLVLVGPCPLLREPRDVLADVDSVDLDEGLVDEPPLTLGREGEALGRVGEERVEDLSQVVRLARNIEDQTAGRRLTSRRAGGEARHEADRDDGRCDLS